MNQTRIATLLCLGLLVGAASLLSVSAASGSKVAKPVTFNKDIAPIFHAKCAECHHPGEAAPFSTLTYKDVRPWAKSIKEKVASRTMPPWHADPHFGEWANDRRLTQAQIDAITAWVDAGAPEGNAKDLPPAPQFAEGWTISKPDVVIQMPDEFTLDASGPDEYQYFDIPTNFTEDKYVTMAEARPGNRKIVHHIIAFVVPPGEPNISKLPKEMRDKALEASLKNSPMYRDGFLIRLKPDQPVHDDLCSAPDNFRGRGFDADSFLVGYAPGRNVDRWEPGTAKKIPAGSIIRFQMHYSKVAGSVQKDRSMVGLVFAKEPPKRLIQTGSVQNIYFKIPPGAERHRVAACWMPKDDVTIYSFGPHMHYRGAAMEYKVTYPDGREQVLLNVPNYNFGWQTNYALKQPLTLPRNSKLMVTAYFDNSAKNKYNPDPAKPVRHGEPTYDEMMMGFLDFTVLKPAVAKIDPKQFDGLLGRYDIGDKRIMTITREGDRLFTHVTAKRELLPESENSFFWNEFPGRLSFVKNEQGEVLEAVFDQGWKPFHAKRIKDAPAGSGQ
ncbi:MAG: thiol-disulfide isomerase [Acidobacteria bacterium]|nr:thiol-disulfide isomerase [Acidobacteriota bacterium]MBI3423655.1 thiol-disulfide isomerase [Acidobacteriota bacterium]